MWEYAAEETEGRNISARMEKWRLVLLLHEEPRWNSCEVEENPVVGLGMENTRGTWLVLD